MLVWLSDQNIYLKISKYWLNHFQSIKNVFLGPNYVRNDVLWIFVGLMDEKI